MMGIGDLVYLLVLALDALTNASRTRAKQFNGSLWAHIVDCRIPYFQSRISHCPQVDSHRMMLMLWELQMYEKGGQSPSVLVHDIRVPDVDQNFVGIIMLKGFL